ncbi:MAG: F0F1 ATP synthase subunit A [Candidatus Paceibacterota bacterium]|jgi:F-type H+-transporting ATPase subunit a
METGFIHQQTIFAEPIVEWLGLNITNSLITSWVAVLLIIGLAICIRLFIKKTPGRLQSLWEVSVEALLDMFDSVTHDRKKTLVIFPFIAAFFFFILVNNYLGLLPGVGTVGHVVKEGSENVFIPFFRGATADLNTTLALALIAVISSHIMGLVKVGAWTHVNKFVNMKALFEIPKVILKDPSAALAKVIEFFAGIVEMVGELAKIASLSLRLFGNIFAGEVLLFSMASLVAYVVPVPFMFLELLVGVVQALVFSMLALVFITLNTESHGH